MITRLIKEKCLVRLLSCLLFVAPQMLWANGAEADFDGKVRSAFIDLRTGPGQRFPVFQILEQGDLFQFVRQKNRWIYVESETGQQGWMHSSDLVQAVNLNDEPYGLGVQDAIPLDDYFELSLGVGNFGGSQSLSLASSYAFTNNLSAEINLGQAIGDLSTTYFFGYQLIHLAKPIKGYRPYVLFGAGRVFLEASSRVVEPVDRQDDFIKAGFGVRKQIDGRLHLKFEYAPYLILRSQDDNDEVNEWKLWLSAVF